MRLTVQCLVIQAMAFCYSNVDTYIGDPNNVPWNTGNIQNWDFLDSGIEIVWTIPHYKLDAIQNPSHLASRLLLIICQVLWSPLYLIWIRIRLKSPDLDSENCFMEIQIPFQSGIRMVCVVQSLNGSVIEPLFEYRTLIVWFSNTSRTRIPTVLTYLSQVCLNFFVFM